MILRRLLHYVCGVDSKIKYYNEYRKHISTHTLPSKLEHLHCTSQITKPIVLPAELKYTYFVHDEPIDITDFMSYDRFLDVKQRRLDVFCYSQITQRLLVPKYVDMHDWKQFMNIDRFYFPIYIHIKEGEYHAAVLLWDIKRSKLHYYDSWGRYEETLLTIFRKIFPHIKNIEYNNIVHQTQNNLCTSYAFNAADRFMNNESFENICNNKTSVRDLLKYRANVMTKPYNKTPHEITEFSLHCAKC